MFHWRLSLSKFSFSYSYFKFLCLQWVKLLLLHLAKAGAKYSPGNRLKTTAVILAASAVRQLLLAVALAGENLVGGQQNPGTALTDRGR